MKKEAILRGECLRIEKELSTLIHSDVIRYTERAISEFSVYSKMNIVGGIGMVILLAIVFMISFLAGRMFIKNSVFSKKIKSAYMIIWIILLVVSVAICITSIHGLITNGETISRMVAISSELS